MSEPPQTGRVTREELLRLARSGQPWSFLPLAAQALRQAPRDAEVRFLASANAARLGLRTIAGDTLAPLEDRAESPEEVGKLAEAIRGLADDAIPLDERRGRLEANLDALRARGLDFGDAGRAWLEGCARRSAFRTLDGNVIFADPARPAEGGVATHDITWARSLVEARAAARSLGAEVASRSGAYPRPLVLEGLSPPWGLREMYDSTPPGSTGCRWRIIALEPDPEALCAGLAVCDLTDALADDRVTLLLGPDAGEQLRAWLSERLDRKLPAGLVVTPGAVRGVRPDPQQILREAGEAQERRRRAAFEAIEARARGRDTAWWTDRYARAMAGTGEPLRVLVPTCRYSTYIQHAARDIAAAFRDQGHEAEVLVEPDDTSTLSRAGYSAAFERVDPDLVVSINYPRRALGGGLVPDNVPLVCWVQDAMPHLFDAELGAAQGELDFMVGALHHAMVARYAYPAERCLFFGVPASAAKFARAGGGDAPASERSKAHEAAATVGAPMRTDPSGDADGPAACDMLIASNHGETPDEMAERFEAECVAGGAPAGLARAICDEMRVLVDEWGGGWLDHAIADHAGPILERFGARDPDALGQVNRSVARPFVNRLLRHRLATWAAEIAERDGLSLRIHGNGWDRIERFAPYAHPPLDHGRPLREAYARAGVTLHASSEAPQHQRLHECVMSGGLPAILVKPEDVPFVIGYGCRHALRRLTATHGRLADRRHCVAAIDDPTTALALSLAQRMPGAKAIPDDPDRAHPERALEDGLMLHRSEGGRPAAPPIPVLEDDLDHVRFTWAIADAMFSSREELRGVVHRARRDPAWRAARSGHAAGISERAFSYERCTREMVSMVACGLEAASASDDGSRALPAA